MIFGLLSPLYHLSLGQISFCAFPSRAGARVSINSSLYLYGFKTESSGRRAAPFLVTMAATINVISLGKMTPNLRGTVGGDIQIQPPPPIHPYFV